MDAVQKEHERLLKKLKTSQSTQNVQSTIDLLQSARDAIAAGLFTPRVQNDVNGTFRQLADHGELHTRSESSFNHHGETSEPGQIVL